MNEMVEWELLIDYYDYSMSRFPFKWVMRDKSITLEKSIRLGYVKRSMQELSFYLSKQSYLDEGSIEKLATFLFEEDQGNIIKFVEKGPCSRYRFEFMGPLLEAFADKNKFPLFFKEEKNQIEYLAKELFVTPEQLCKIKVTENATVEDLFLLKRFFVLLFYLQEEVFSNEKNERNIATSVTPILSEEALLYTFDIFTGNSEKSKELLNLFTWNGEGKLDLQYTPILRYKNKYVVLPGIFALSETFRNFIAHSYYKNNSVVNRDGATDSLINLCKDAFEKCPKKYTIKDTLKYKYKGHKGEIDFLACSDENIFLFECKDPLMPTSNYEMRSTYDYLEKAQNQLTVAKEALEDKSFKRNYFSTWGIEDKNQTVHTCILLGNRLFSGCEKFEHPIRYALEMKMVLNDGAIKSGVAEWCYWSTLEYSEVDLIRFLSHKDPLTLSFFNSMVKINERITCGNIKVCYQSYCYDMKKHLVKLDEEFRTVKKEAQLFDRIVFDVSKRSYIKRIAKRILCKIKRHHRGYK